MVDQSKNTTAFLKKFAEQDPEGLEGIWNRYQVRLIALARKIISKHHPSAKDYDASDVANEALMRLYLGWQGADAPGNRRALWIVFRELVYRTVVSRARKELSLKRGGSMAQATSVDELDVKDESRFTTNPRPTEHDARIFVESIKDSIKTLDTGRVSNFTEVFAEYLRGNSTREIAAQLRITERMVQRRLEKIYETAIALVKDV